MFIPITPDEWNQGRTPADFLAAMTRNQAEMQARIQRLRLSPAQAAFFQRPPVAPAHVLVMTEDWCSDSLMSLPILWHILAALPAAGCRIFVRSQSPELKSRFETQGIANIPVFSFLDENFVQLGVWVERSRLAHEKVSAWKAAHPEMQAIRSDPALSDEEKRARLRPLNKAFVAEMTRWYDEEGLQDATVSEIQSLLSAAGSGVS